MLKAEHSIPKNRHLLPFLRAHFFSERHLRILGFGKLVLCGRVNPNVPVSPDDDADRGGVLVEIHNVVSHPPDEVGI